MLLKNLAEMVSVLIAHTFGDILNTGIRLGEKQLFGFFHTQTDQIIDRCVSYFVFEQARDVERTQVHIARNLIQGNFLGEMALKVVHYLFYDIFFII